MRPHVPRDPLGKREVDVGRRAREALGQPVVRAQQHLRELAAGVRLGELPVAVRVLEVPARHPQHGATVDDVGRGADERMRQVFVDLEVDLDAGRKPDERGGLFDETRDHRHLVRDDRERVGCDVDATHAQPAACAACDIAAASAWA